ncbi:MULTISPECIES: ABC transporter ATP-binding protein [Rhizobium]|uniref:Spermidine/putrescine transport system ATP-binding protein n=1 Tax=Rhizobium lusitanum TaxID=293958 RepID=A0A1C3WSL6_9HYPH|nr:ABC transporter ATP-binding protein [Rhizobium lusitanum]NKJ04193.1 putative spermidine/putrescine transport system ATP-binding protein/spermidine/putrescine transport system ATP-binding protein [Rhizobium sp. SG741]NRP89509.1 Spermidine/putrescine import ATP-binding protein PotA [Ensifer adhaerens]NTJ10365.1 ABC transporter ATP-binding protein [Rhizobium lusitanum]SCB42724.1 spermidine/putrescine transport system ATP-binding protein [Rhizobium lusitanum]
MTNVEVSSVAKTYGRTPVLADISTDFTEGSFTSLLGPSGSGKTTLLRIIAGFITPDSGKVAIGGQDVTETPVWARNIGMVFQSYALFPHMTVAENVAFGLARRGIRGAEARQQVDRALEMVRLPGFGDRKPKQLSGGQQQRVALARAMVIKPSVLLLDEPLSALDRRLRQEMQVELLRIQRETGLTTIFVTHDQEEALTLSDKVAILDRGRIVQIGAPAEVYERPKTRFAAQFLGDSNFLNGTIANGGVRLADGTLVRCHGPLSSTGNSATLAVRPEKMSILPAGTSPEAGLNALAARIETVIYAGPALTYVLVTPDGTSLKLFAQNRDGTVLASGTDVTLAWSPDHTIAVED